MAILTANPDGSSNAKAGDVVVTGGGIYQKNADGSSTKLSSLKDYIGTDKTKDYSVLKTIANSYAAKQGATGGSAAGIESDTKIVSGSTYTNPAKEEKYVAQSVDDNGLISGMMFTPIDYSGGSSSGSSGSDSSGASKVLGYIIVGLVGIALLDRFMNGSGGK